MTLAVPAEPAGVVHVIDVVDTTVTFVQVAPPTVTVVPAAKFVPAIVMTVPPPSAPDAGLTADTVGTGSEPILRPAVVPTKTEDPLLAMPP